MLTSAHASPAIQSTVTRRHTAYSADFSNLLERTLYTLVSYINLHAVDLHIISLGTPPTVQLLQISVVPLLFKAGWHR
jgi:hypothetical protein